MTNCTEGLAGVEVCGPVQGKIDVTNFKTFEIRNIPIHKSSPLGALNERRIQTEPLISHLLLLLVPRALEVYECSTGIANHLATPFSKRDKVH